jgi:hypothetical protein
MRRFTASDSSCNVDQVFRKHWFRFRSFDGFRWHYMNTRDHPRADFWVILKQKQNNAGWVYYVKGSNGLRKVAIESVLFSDPQLAALAGMVFVEKLIGPRKLPITGPAPVIHLAEHQSRISR